MRQKLTAALAITGSEFSRNFVNWKMPVTLAITVFLYCMAMNELIDMVGDVITTLRYVLAGMRLYPVLTVPLCMWCFGNTIYEDLRSGHVENVMTRCGYKMFFIIKMIVSVITFMAVNIAGVFITVMIMGINYPMIIRPESYRVLGGVFELVCKGRYVSFILAATVFCSLSFSVYLILSEILSVFIDNMFFIYFSPIVMFYMVINMHYLVVLPRVLIPGNVFYIGGTGAMDTAAGGLLYALAYIIILIILLNLIFIKRKNIAARMRG